MMEVKPSLKAVLKRLKLSGIVPLLPDRSAYAQKSGLSPLDFLELALQVEIDRRQRHNLSNRVDRACFQEEQTFLKTIHQSRADNSTERVMRSLLAPDLPHHRRLRTAPPERPAVQRLLRVIIERHRRASTIVTSNRTIEEWIPLR